MKNANLRKMSFAILVLSFGDALAWECPPATCPSKVLSGKWECIAWQRVNCGPEILHGDGSPLPVSRAFVPSGIYRGVNQWGVLAIRKSSDTEFFADDKGENQYFSHTTHGKMPKGTTAKLLNQNPQDSRSTWNVTITRTNRQNGCVTELYGTITFWGTEKAVIQGSGSDGRCDVPKNYSETVEMKREQPPEPKFPIDPGWQTE